MSRNSRAEKLYEMRDGIIHETHHSVRERPSGGLELSSQFTDRHDHSRSPTARKLGLNNCFSAKIRLPQHSKETSRTALAILAVILGVALLVG